MPLFGSESRVDCGCFCQKLMVNKSSEWVPDSQQESLRVWHGNSHFSSAVIFVTGGADHMGREDEFRLSFFGVCRPHNPPNGPGGPKCTCTSPVLICVLVSIDMEKEIS